MADLLTRGPVILIKGTWAHEDPWPVAFQAMLEERGLTVLPGYSWTCRLEVGKAAEWDWLEAGKALCWFAEAKARGMRVSVVAHSHAGNVLAYAADFGLRLDVAVTVATPVRDELMAQYATLAAKAQRWTHFWSEESEGVGYQRLGEFSPDLYSLRRLWDPGREMPLAHQNVSLAGLGLSHGDLVRRPDLWRPPPVGRGLLNVAFGISTPWPSGSNLA